MAVIESTCAGCLYRLFQVVWLLSILILVVAFGAFRTLQTSTFIPAVQKRPDLVCVSLSLIAFLCPNPVCAFVSLSTATDRESKKNRLSLGLCWLRLLDNHFVALNSYHLVCGTRVNHVQYVRLSCCICRLLPGLGALRYAVLLSFRRRYIPTLIDGTTSVDNITSGVCLSNTATAVAPVSSFSADFVQECGLSVVSLACATDSLSTDIM